MLRYYNVSDVDKEGLIKSISSYFGIEPEYQGPSVEGHLIGRWLVLHDGNLMTGEDDEGKIEALLSALRKAGFVVEEDLDRRIPL